MSRVDSKADLGDFSKRVLNGGLSYTLFWFSLYV